VMLRNIRSGAAGDDSGEGATGAEANDQASEWRPIAVPEPC
jgi:hypothetical protein